MDRALLEQNRALAQRIDNLENQVRRLKLRGPGAGATATEQFTTIEGFSDSVPVTLVEFDVDPGRWLVLFGATAMIADHAGGQDYTGKEMLDVILATRPTGASTSDETQVAIVSGGTAAVPITFSAGLLFAQFPMFSFETVSSETGLSLRLYGRAAERDGDAHSVMWNWGKMIAVPL